MQYEPTLQELFISAFRDSLDETVILLLITGFVFLSNVKTISRMYPLILSAIVTTITAISFSSFAPFGGLKWHFILWIPLLAHIGYSLSRHGAQKKADKWLSLAPHGISISAFIFLSLSILRGYLSKETVCWPVIHESSLSIVLFYLIAAIAPWRFFSLHKPKEIARVLLYVAIGMFVLRGSMWCYGLFNASLKERPGSFRLKGVVYAKEMAVGWRFQQLHSLIERYWLYPQHPENTHSSPPIVKNKQLVESGLQQAESFRQSLLKEIAPNLSKAELLSQAIMDFQEIAEPSLTNHVSLKRFILDTETLIELMNGSEYPIEGRDAFGEFSGRWYGEWDAKDVDHYWRPLEYFEPVQTIPGVHPLNLRVRQYCWVGDGFGWNAIASIPNPVQVNEFKDVILGIVYHVKNNDPSNIILTRPHLGLSIGYNQLIWITPSGVFLEEIIPDMKKSKERYVITGFNYSIENKTLRSEDDAFQAMYSRKPSARTPYYKFKIDLSISIP